jgi:hypothetical protein
MAEALLNPELLKLWPKCKPGSGSRRKGKKCFPIDYPDDLFDSP